MDENVGSFQDIHARSVEANVCAVHMGIVPQHWDLFREIRNTEELEIGLTVLFKKKCVTSPLMICLNVKLDLCCMFDRWGYIVDVFCCLCGLWTIQEVCLIWHNKVHLQCCTMRNKPVIHVAFNTSILRTASSWVYNWTNLPINMLLRSHPAELSLAGYAHEEKRVTSTLQD